MGGQLSSQQRSEFLDAYRNTFRVEDHGRALKKLYVYFATEFGVDADMLRATVLEDLAENRKLYAKLRAELAAQNAASTKPVAKKPKPSAAVTTKAKKKQSKKPKQTNASNVQPKLVVQNRRTGRGPERDCRICGQTVRTNQNGTMALHNAPNRNGILVPCPGAGLKVAPPKSDNKRPDDRSEPSSIRTISGGLGGLGRR